MWGRQAWGSCSVLLRRYAEYYRKTDALIVVDGSGEFLIQVRHSIFPFLYTVFFLSFPHFLIINRSGTCKRREVSWVRYISNTSHAPIQLIHIGQPNTLSPTQLKHPCPATWESILLSLKRIVQLLSTWPNSVFPSNAQFVLNAYCLPCLKQLIIPSHISHGCVVKYIAKYC